MKILNEAREKQQVTYKGNPIILTADLSAKLCRPEENRRIYLKYWKGKIYNQDYLLLVGYSKDLIQNWWRNKKLFRQVKVKRIQYHQTSFTTNVKGTYIVKKYKRRKRIYKSTPNNQENGNRNMIITLNVNGLNAPTKRHRLAEWMHKQDLYINAVYKKSTSDLKTHIDWKWRMEKYIPHKWKAK